MSKRQSPSSPLIGLQRNISQLLDAGDEAANNAARGEADFLRVNLRAVFELAELIRRKRRGKRMRRLLRPDQARAGKRE